VTISPDNRHAHVIGLGLIGCSLAMALADVGWSLTGTDVDSDVVRVALERGIIANDSPDGADVVVVATPAGSVIPIVTELLERDGRPELLVTDVAGVKSAIAYAISDARFVAGHPMAGSERRGIEGARRDLFHGCTWVLTPTATTESSSYTKLHTLLRELGVNVIALAPEVHDRLVATASHIPHLVAGALMNEAAAVAEEDEALLQLAAGGFRDMTRISAGDPHIWPDVLIENASTILPGIESLQERLGELREMILKGDASGLLRQLSDASVARRQLPGRAVPASDMVYVRVPVLDRPGVLSEITRVAGDSGVNIYDIEISHNVEGRTGTLLLAIGHDQLERFRSELARRGYAVSLDREDQ